MSEMRRRLDRRETGRDSARACRRTGIRPAIQDDPSGCAGERPVLTPTPQGAWRRMLCFCYHPRRGIPRERKDITEHRRHWRVHTRFAACQSVEEDQAGPDFKENRPAFNIKEATNGQTPRKRPGGIGERPQAGASGRIRTDQT